jgi:hypothetical protein
MAKMRKKSDLPQKICVTCGRPMAWRKAWAKNWDNVLHCSDRCRSRAKGASPNAVAATSETVKVGPSVHVTGSRA